MNQETVNINGKEYSKDDFFETISIGSYYDDHGCDMVDDIIEDFWDSQNKDFPRHEPEPPKLRPMSELPKGKLNITALFECEHSGRHWKDAVICDKIVELNEGGRYHEKEGYTDFNNGKLLGWFPSVKLPNPNEIELP